jgi:SPP1 gp7 family putative phage head morphogenesis protein
VATPEPGRVPFDEAIAYFRGKVANVPTETWRDMVRQEHAVGFAVAGAQKAELLADFRAAIDKAIAEGTTLDEFRRDFDAIVAKHGWSYRGSRGWRTRVIFETNLRTAYMAGRWKQIEANRDAFPFLEYQAVLDRRTRPQHRTWDGTVLPVEHPFWNTHYPPNGWGCRCTVVPRTPRQLVRQGKKVTDPAPASGAMPRSVVTPEGNRIVEVPPGIDEGWDYNVGKAARLQDAARQAMATLSRVDAPIGAALAAALQAEAKAAAAAEYRAWAAPIINAAIDERDFRSDGTSRVVGVLRDAWVAALADLGYELASVAVLTTSNALIRMAAKDFRTAQDIALYRADLLRLPEMVDEPQAVLLEIATGNLLLVFPSAAIEDERDGKFVVELNSAFAVKGAPRGRRREVANRVKSGGLVARLTLTDPSQYRVIAGEL